MKRQLLFAAALLAGALGFNANAQLQNADFEGEYKVHSNPNTGRAIYQPEGWTVNYSAGDVNDMTALKTGDLQYNDNFANRPQPENGGDKTYWIRLRWGKVSTQLFLSQTPDLPQGKYTLTADAYMNGYADNAAVATINAGNKSTVIDKQVWTNYTVEFTVTPLTLPTISFGVDKKGVETEIVVAFDNFDLTYESNYTAGLADAISYATQVNSKLNSEELKSAIATAQSVLENKTDKIDYQETINEAIPALKAAVAKALPDYTDAENKDLTFVIANNDFETSPTFDVTDLGTKDVANATPTEGTESFKGAVSVYGIKGWELMNTDNSLYARTFTMPYNKTIYVQSGNGAGNQEFTTPENNSSVKEGNNNLLFVEANWLPDNDLGVKQTVTLSAGKYTLTFDTYVSNVLTNATSLCGVSYGNTKNYGGWPTELNTWTENTIEFTLNEPTDVTISMGYKKGKGTGNNGGGTGESPFLFIDNVKLVYNGIGSLLEAAIEEAKTIADNGFNVGNDVFQIAPSALETFEKAIETAEKPIEGETAKKAALAALVEAQNNYAESELNAPGNELYNIINVSADYLFKDKAITFKSAFGAEVKDNNISMEWTEAAGSIYPQGILFEAVDGEINTYKLSYTRADNTKIYIATGKSVGTHSTAEYLRATTDKDLALKVKVAASMENENVWYLYNTECEKDGKTMRIGGNGNDANNKGLFTGEFNTYQYYDMLIAPAAEYTAEVEIAGGKYSTIIVPFDVAEIDADVYSVSEDDVEGNVLKLQPVEGGIKANTPYIVYAEKQIDNLSGIGAAYTDKSTFTEGLLTGTYATNQKVPTKSYVLQTNDENEQGFYVVNDGNFTHTQYRAYLTYEAPVTGGGDEDGHGIKAFYFNFAGDATAIEAVPEVAEGAKVFYNLAGQRVANPTKGIYIVNGQKVLVK